MKTRGLTLYRIDTVCSMMSIKNNRNDSTNNRHANVDTMSMTLFSHGQKNAQIAIHDKIVAMINGMIFESQWKITKKYLYLKK